MEGESGRSILQILQTKRKLINMMGSMKMTRNMDMVSSLGKVEINIMETIIMMSDKVMVRCNGLMVDGSKVIG